MTLLAQVEAPPAWRRLAFISDLHLDEGAPATLAAFERWLAGLDADALFILGDLFEAWVGDDAIDLPVAQRLRAALQRFGRPCFFLHGNRDFLLGPALGMQLLAETCRLSAFGDAVLLTHGDAQCLDDSAYQAFRLQVRSAAWQTAFLQRPLPERLQLAAQMRDASRAAQGRTREMGLPFADPDAALCREQLQAAGCQRMLHGHTHRPGRYPLGEGFERLVLSDWDFDQGAPRGDCLIWSAEGWQRQPVWG